MNCGDNTFSSNDLLRVCQRSTVLDHRRYISWHNYFDEVTDCIWCGWTAKVEEDILVTIDFQLAAATSFDFVQVWLRQLFPSVDMLFSRVEVTVCGISLMLTMADFFGAFPATCDLHYWRLDWISDRALSNGD